VSGIGIKWKRSDSSNSDCVELMIQLPIFDFYQVVSALTTPTPTSSQVKTSLNWDFSDFDYFYAEDIFLDSLLFSGSSCLGYSES